MTVVFHYAPESSNLFTNMFLNISNLVSSLCLAMQSAPIKQFLAQFPNVPTESGFRTVPAVTLTIWENSHPTDVTIIHSCKPLMLKDCFEFCTIKSPHWWFISRRTLCCCNILSPQYELTWRTYAAGLVSFLASCQCSWVFLNNTNNNFTLVLFIILSFKVLIFL